MANKPELTKNSDTVYGCYICKDWTATLDPKRDTTPQKRQSRAERYFADHLRQRHSGEDFSQAAARILREATRD